MAIQRIESLIWAALVCFHPIWVLHLGWGSPKGLIHNLFEHLFTLGILVVETCFLDIVTTQNGHPRYVKHGLGRIYVFFTLFG